MARAKDGARGVTLSKVARQVGVSLSTASNAFNRPDQLSEELRARILDTAESLGYVGADPAARAMARRRYDTIGLVISEHLSYAFHSAAAIEILRGVTTACEQAGVAVTLLPMRSQRDECPLITTAGIDALGLYAVMDDAPVIHQALRRGIPVVTADQPEIPSVPFTGIDESSAARRAAEHLIALGHKRIGILSLPMAPGEAGSRVVSPLPDEIGYRVTRERLRGYLDVIAEHGLPAPTVFTCARSDAGAGQAAASAVLVGSERPTALLCMSDEIAIGAEVAAASLGIDVPRELSVVGFDALPGAVPAPVPLTTISQNIYERGLLLGAWLVRAPDAGARRIFSTDLVLRDSTAEAP